MSAIAKVASLWDIELEANERTWREADELAPFAPRCHISLDGKDAVPLTDVERDLMRGALMYALVNFHGFSRFANKNDKWHRPEQHQLIALLHGLAHVLDHGEPSVRDTKELAAWRRSRPQLVRRRPLRMRPRR